jgi:hypothetical protein
MCKRNRSKNIGFFFLEKILFLYSKQQLNNLMKDVYDLISELFAYAGRKSTF